MKQKKTNKMESMPMGRLVLDMSLPMMLSLLIQSLYNIVDSIFVARLSEQALTATSLAYPVQMLMVAVGVGTAVGLNAILSKTLGAGRTEEASHVAVTGVLLAAISGIVFMIAGILFSGTLAHAFTSNQDIADQCRSYLFICMVFSVGNMLCMTFQRLMQATGRSFQSMLILASGAVTNIILDPILIFGLLGAPALGIRGAAIATVIGQWVSMVVGIILQKTVNREVTLSFKGFHWKKDYVKGIYRVGFPTIITQAMQSMMVTGFNAILQPFSTTAVAFFGVYYKLQTFLFMPMNGLGQAAIPIVGYNYGSKNKKRIYEAVRIIYPTAIIIALAGTVLFVCIPGTLLSLFSAGQEMLLLGIPAIRIMAVCFAPAAAALISGYITSGLQDGVTNMLIALVRLFLPLIPCAWFIGNIAGIDYVWYAFWISEICGIILAYIRIHSVFRKKVQSLS